MYSGAIAKHDIVISKDHSQIFQIAQVLSCRSQLFTSQENFIDLAHLMPNTFLPHKKNTQTFVVYF